MKEVFKEYALQLLQKLEAGWNFLEGEIPPFINEVILYYSIYYWVLVVSFLFAAIVGTRLVIKTYKEDPVDPDVLILPGIVGAVAGTIGFFANLFQAIKVTVAPRLFLIEWLGEVISQ